MCIKARNLQDSKILIVTTTSALYQWQNEYERWLEEQARLAEDEEPDGYWDWALSGDYDEISDETVEAIRGYK